MSCWLTDPSLYIEYYDSAIKLWRLHENFKTPLSSGQDYTYVKTMTEYLDLVDHSFPWKESDCNAFKDFLYRYDIMVNCQGLVLSVTFPRQRQNGNRTGGPSKRFRSLEVVDLSRFGLPAPSIPFREIQYLESRKPAPVESTPKENELEELREKEKKAKEVLERQVSDLELKLTTCRGSMEPWMSYSTVLGDWVSYEGLVINQEYQRPPGRAYILTETGYSPDLDEDNTTNIQPNQFYRALMDGFESMTELTVVKIEKLSPNKEKAKFKPDIWFKFDNAGKTFAAREPTEQERDFYLR